LSQSRRDSLTTLDAALCSPVVRAAPPVTSGFTNAYAGGVLLGDGRQAFLKASGPEFPFPVLSLGRPLATDTDALGAGAQNDHLIHFDLRPDNLLVGRRAGEVADRAYVLEWNWVTLGPAWCDWVSVIPAMQAQGHDLGELMDSTPLSRSADPHALDVWLALLAVYMLVCFEDEPPPGATMALRRHQRFYAQVFLDSLATHRGWL